MIVYLLKDCIAPYMAPGGGFGSLYHIGNVLWERISLEVTGFIFLVIRVSMEGDCLVVTRRQVMVLVGLHHDAC